MCTLTIMRTRGTPTAAPASSPGALVMRIVMNRDEQRLRPPGIGPRVLQCGDRSAVMPIDPVSGGSWVGCNDHAIVVALLNATSTPPRPGAPVATGTPTRSRGVIVPMLLAAANLHEALDIATSLEPQEFPAFRVLIAVATRCVVLHADGRSISVHRTSDLSRPMMLTSSGLGDELVQAPRGREFERAFAAAMSPNTATSLHANLAAQDAFHMLTDPHNPELAVCMARADARTVSVTTLDVFEDRAEMTCQPLRDDLTRDGRPQVANIQFTPHEAIR